MAGAEFIYQKTYPITDKIAIRHPTVGDIITSGEEKYYSNVCTLTAIPSDMKSVLFDAGIDYMEISDLKMFSLMVKNLSEEDTRILIPGIDFSEFKLYENEDGDEVFYNEKKDITIDFYVHMRMQECLCGIHKIKKNVDKAGNAYTKRILIDEDRKKRKLAIEKEFKSSLSPLISAMVNSSGFKYNYESVQTLLFGQFMDAVARAQTIYAADHLMQGIYNGTVDAKKINADKTDWMRDI